VLSTFIADCIGDKIMEQLSILRSFEKIVSFSTTCCNIFWCYLTAARWYSAWMVRHNRVHL